MHQINDMSNNKSDFLTIVGKYVDGKLEYSYPRWMMMYFSGIDFLPQVPATDTAHYEIFNPSQMELVENVQYSARLISFDDGDIAEIIDQFEPNGTTE